MKSIRKCKILVSGLVLPATAALLATFFFVILPGKPVAGEGLSGTRLLACPPSMPPQSGPTLIVNTTVMTTCDGICGPDHCTLGEAIHLANELAGENTIELGAGAIYTVTAADNGVNGFPLITSTMTLHGNDATITRPPAAPNFRFLSITSDGTLTLAQVTIRNGRLTSWPTQGGAVFTAGRLNISESVFAYNHCDAEDTRGGAIFIASGEVSIKNTTFYSNTATSYMSYGGAIYSAGGQIDILNSTFVDNLAGGNSYDLGGAIYSSSAVTITNSTFSGNRAKDHGGTIFVLSGGSVLLRNTIIANGSGAASCNGNVVDGGGNLSWPDSSCPGLNQDPKLSPLANNGGANLTMALQAGSPAIHHADPAICPVTDQRGWPRLLQGLCDSGAYEWSWLAFQPFISK